MNATAETPRELWEQRLRSAIMQSAPLLDARTVPVDSRSRAIERALAAGLPGLRDEAWRNADLRFLTTASLAPLPPAPADEPEASELPDPLPGFSRLVFSNGRFLEHLSDPVPELRRRATALVPERTKHERFGWLNDAFATDVARLVVAGERRLELLFLSSNTPDPQAYYPRLEVTLEASASLTLAERHLGAARQQCDDERRQPRCMPHREARCATCACSSTAIPRGCWIRCRSPSTGRRAMS